MAAGKTVIYTFLFACALLPGRLRAENLPKAQKEAREATWEFIDAAHTRHKQLQRLQKDLRYISEVLDREIVLDRKLTLRQYSENALQRLAEIRRTGNIHHKLLPVLAQLEALFRSMPGKLYAQPYARGLVKYVAHELRWTADNAKSQEELLRLLENRLLLPDEVDAAGWLKTDVPIDEFVAQGVIKVFLAKHRLRRPKSHAATTAERIVGGEHNVQVGVDVVGTVTRHTKFSIDGDYTFDFGDLHIELTPEWRAAHPKIPRPKTGQRVRVRGWTYFDVFHKAEEEYNPEDPVLGVNRVTQWEIHPVLDIEVLPQE